MQAIGGYFSLELPNVAAYHGKNAIKLNTGRNCLELILLNRCYQKVYVPYYTCDAVMEPIEKLGLKYEFYHINNCFEIIDDIILNPSDVILYTNYWGINRHHVKTYVEKYGKQIIVDNTQAFFDKPLNGIDTFYTCRKFFGVPDGAYLYTDINYSKDLPISYSYELASYLMKRIDISPEAAYDDFHEAEYKLSNQDVRLMSHLTDRIMHSINYTECIIKRKNNFDVLHKHLGDTNKLPLCHLKEYVPMVYPYLTDDEFLRDRLISNRVFSPKYWPDVEKRCKSNDYEIYLTNHLVPLPIDQRYGFEDMLYIVNLVKDKI